MSIQHGKYSKKSILDNKGKQFSDNAMTPSVQIGKGIIKNDCRAKS